MSSMRSLPYLPLPLRGLLVLGLGIGAPMALCCTLLSFHPFLPDAVVAALVSVGLYSFVVIPMLILGGASLASMRTRDPARRKCHRHTAYLALLALGVVWLLAKWVSTIHWC